MAHVHFLRTRFAALLLMTGLLPASLSAQVDLAGNWQRRAHQDWQERVPGPEAVDYLGLPINDEARTKALSYTASILSLPERQCLMYTPQYVVIGPQGFKIWAEFEPATGKVLAWKLGAAPDRAVITIWMDGRPHPSELAPHTFAGFTTGVWEGDVLTTYTTHIKEGYLRRNGTPTSDQATVTEHIMRHGDLLTISAHIEDPVYLTEPYVLSRMWQLDPSANLPPTPGPCTPEAEVARLDGDGKVPHFLPGKNPFMGELTKFYHIPEETVMGGAETMYPEYRKKLKAAYVAPEKCVRYCCGWEGTLAFETLKTCIGRGFASPEEPHGRR
jgi:hypothetical protein